MVYFNIAPVGTSLFKQARPRVQCCGYKSKEGRLIFDPMIHPGWSTLLILFLVCTCTSTMLSINQTGGLCAQTPISFGEQYEMHSEILGENRLLNVLLPAENTASTAKEYPVIYLLDGAVNEDFFHTAGLVRYFESHAMMPPVILVGIANVDRKRDFTYPSKDPRDVRDFPTTGGSAKFIDFLQTELTTWTEKTFRTTEHRTLIGQSLGGLLATEVLLKHPGTFNDYVIVSPSMWWDSSRIYRELEVLHDQLAVFPERLFVAVGEEYPVMVDGSRKLAQLFTSSKGNTEATFLPLMDEDHNTILHEALYRAFDRWYDAPTARPYRYANAYNGLRVRSGPSPDSTVIGTLKYGEGLTLPGTEQPVPATINGLEGNWKYVSTDWGRGWVFDVYLSPWRVFNSEEPLATYARRQLILNDSLVYANQGDEDDEEQMLIHKGPFGNQLIKHNRWESCHLELRLTGLTKSQARVSTANWLRCHGFNPKNMTGRRLLGGIEFWEFQDINENEEEVYLKITYLNGILAIRQECQD